MYEKGAEIVRLYHTLLGAEGFRRAPVWQPSPCSPKISLHLLTQAALLMFSYAAMKALPSLGIRGYFPVFIFVGW